MNAFAPVLTLLLMFLVTGCSSVPAPITIEPPLPYDDAPASARAARRLEQPMALPADAATLESVIAAISNATGVPIHLHHHALNAAGVTPATPIDIPHDPMPAAALLDGIVRACNQLNILEPLDWSIADGVVHLSTHRQLTKDTVMRAYDFKAYLVPYLPNHIPMFELDTSMSSTIGASEAGKTTTDPPASERVWCETCREISMSPTRTEAIDQVITFIQDSVGRQQDWQAYGGEVSSVRELNDQLWIKTTWRNHRQIEAIFAKLTH